MGLFTGWLKREKKRAVLPLFKWKPFETTVLSSVRNMEHRVLIAYTEHYKKCLQDSIKSLLHNLVVNLLLPRYSNII